VGLNALFHWLWAEDVAPLLFLSWFAGEAREALEEAQEEGHDSSGACFVPNKKSRRTCALHCSPDLRQVASYCFRNRTE
jgi:hypothetical protein